MKRTLNLLLTICFIFIMALILRYLAPIILVKVFDTIAKLVVN